MIALLCAVKTEAERLLESIVDMRSATLGSKLLIEGTLGDHRVLLCVGGIGKVNAAHTATLMVTRFSPEALVLFGSGGAYPSSGAQVGDVALAKEEIAGDEGVLTQHGFRDLEHLGIPLLKTPATMIYSVFPASQPLMRQSLQTLAADYASGERSMHVGRFVTVSTCTGVMARARELEERHHALCENMEGAAVAQVAELHGVPWLEVRGISNIVEDRDMTKWDLPRAAGAAQQAVLRIVEAWRP